MKYSLKVFRRSHYHDQVMFIFNAFSGALDDSCDLLKIAVEKVSIILYLIESFVITYINFKVVYEV